MKKIRPVKALTFILSATLLVGTLGYMKPTRLEAAGGDVSITSTYFPDSVFLNSVKKFDTNQDGVLSQAECENVLSLNVSNLGIGNLTGIKYFTKLTSLFVDSNKLTSLDLSGNTALKMVSCSNNQISSLKVSACTELFTLACANNNLTSIDVSKNVKLTSLNCSNNQLSQLSVIYNTQLTTLNCSDNKLGSINVGNCTALEELKCSSNNLSSVNLTNNTKLKRLYCDHNSLSSLDTSKNGVLNTLYCNNNRLTTLDVSKNPYLGTLICYSNNISSVNKSSTISTIECDFNTISGSNFNDAKTVSASGTLYIDSSATYDLANIKGFDISKASGWKCTFTNNSDSNSGSCRVTVTGTVIKVASMATAKKYDNTLISCNYAYSSSQVIPCTFHVEWVDENQPTTAPTTEKPTEKPTEASTATTQKPTEKPTEATTVAGPNVDVQYRTHVQGIGWQSYVKNGSMAGTSGQSKRLEGIQIKVSGNSNVGVAYTTHCQTYGWLPWSRNGEMNGTEGESKRLEAIKIQLTGTDKDKYDVYYRVHAQTYGWLGWAKNGQMAGTAGLSRRLEGIEIVVKKKGEVAPGQNSGYYKVGNGASGTVNVSGITSTNILYRTHVQSFGWQGWKYNGAMSGTSGQSKRLEGIQIKLSNQQYAGNVLYRTYVQDYKWMPTVRNGAIAGTSGESKRLEAIQISLDGVMATKYDIYYRVHSQQYGWLGWAKNGETAGTIGYGYRLESIEVRLVKKGANPPGITTRPVVIAPGASE